MMRSVTISLYIDVTPDMVYSFASDPANLPAWVPSFFLSIEKVNGRWVAQSPEGEVTFAFVDANPYHVLDHTITFASGVEITNPMRVIPNGDGSELMFTLFQPDGMSDEEFEDDLLHVQNDLDMLRELLEDEHVHTRH